MLTIKMNLIKADIENSKQRNENEIINPKK